MNIIKYTDLSNIIKKQYKSIESSSSSFSFGRMSNGDYYSFFMNHFLTNLSKLSLESENKMLLEYPVIFDTYNYKYFGKI